MSSLFHAAIQGWVRIGLYGALGWGAVMIALLLVIGVWVIGYMIVYGDAPR